MLLYITMQCGAKPNMDVNLLLSLLYFCDFNHYELHEEQLTGLRYTKQSFGPSPKQALRVIKEMEDEKKLLRFKSSYAGVPHIKYLPGKHADLRRISAAEKEVIDRVIEQFSNWPAHTLNAYSREDMPWRATEQGKSIDYELVFYRRPPYTVRVYESDFVQSGPGS
ncbi:MAG: SocA family protein [Bacteroidetes bacterium]|nr:SocA family protein [Bacteroidota bacterium]